MMVDLDGVSVGGGDDPEMRVLLVSGDHNVLRLAHRLKKG